MEIIDFKSHPDYFYDEKDGKKNNTIRAIDVNDKRFPTPEEICASFLNFELKDKSEKFRVVCKSNIKHFVGEYLGDIFNSYGEFIECKNLTNYNNFMSRHYPYHFRGQKNTLVMLSNIDDDRTNKYFYFMFIKWSKEKRFFIKNKNLFK